MPRPIAVAICLAASVMAEFDACARPSAILGVPLDHFASLGQGYGRSLGYAVTYTSGNVYVGGSA